MTHDEGSCTEAIHRLYEYLDGELTPALRMVIQQHLDDCLPCLEAFDFEAELRSIVAQKCRDTVPDGLRLRIVEALQTEFGPSPSPLRGQTPGPLAAGPFAAPPTGPGSPLQPPSGRSPLDPLV